MGGRRCAMQPEPLVDRTVLLAFGITGLSLLAGVAVGYLLVAVLR